MRLFIKEIRQGRLGGRFRSLGGLAAVALALTLPAYAAQPAPALPGEKPPVPVPTTLAGPRLTPEPDFGKPTETPQARLQPDKPEARQSAVDVPLALAPASTPGPWEIPTLDLSFAGGPHVFRIGYIPRPAEGGMDETLGRRLGEFLQADRDLRRALRSEGYSPDIAVLPADGYNDLASRLEQEQFDLAFCPAAVFAALGGGYRVILQERHPGDIVDSRGDEPARRQGVIFVGPTSPLFRQAPTTATLSRVLAENEFAVPSAYDAAGFHYPCLALADEFGVSPRQLRLRFCGSSREVVKHVVSGLAAIGACDSAALDHWLAEAVPNLPLEDIVWPLPISMRPIPTDPVIVRQSLDPASSEIGRRIRDALQRFFLDRESAGFGLLKGRDESYDGLRRDLIRLEEIRERGGRS